MGDSEMKRGGNITDALSSVCSRGFRGRTVFLSTADSAADESARSGKKKKSNLFMRVCLSLF